MAKLTYCGSARGLGDAEEGGISISAPSFLLGLSQKKKNNYKNPVAPVLPALNHPPCTKLHTTNSYKLDNPVYVHSVAQTEPLVHQTSCSHVTMVVQSADRKRK